MWDDVGEWISNNAGNGAALVGSLLTGNIPGAVAAGISMVSGATGTDDPEKVLASLKNDPATLLKLKQLALEEEVSIRNHIRQMQELKLKDEAARHHETQETIRAGDKAEDPFVRRTRPAMAWASLCAGLVYVFIMDAPDLYILGALLTLPWAYAGLRQVGKGIDAVTKVIPQKKMGPS